MTQMTYTQNAFAKDDLNLFLNGLLDGGLIGIDMEDFAINNIDYTKLSIQVKTLIENYQSDNPDQIQNLLNSLGSVFSLISKQAEASQFTGPTADLINKFAVPLIVPGEFIFTFKTSLIIYGASLSNEIWKGQNINLANLTGLGENLGTLAAKLYYDGKYDFENLFPLAFPSLRLLQSNTANPDTQSTWTKKRYQNFEIESLFSLRKIKLGNKNPNHAKQNEEEAKKLKVKVIEKELKRENVRNLQTSTNPPVYDFRTAYDKCSLALRDQKQCGSCWAFSTSGVFEKRICQSTKQVLINRFSPQFLVSCSKNDFGCDGGTLYGSWDHLQSVGITLDACVPYSGLNDTCPVKCADGSALKIFKSVANTITLIKGDVERIKTEIIKGGPVVTTMVEIYSDFFSYGSGIYVSDKKQFIGYHAMQIIGWGDGYWIVENSWGPSWGENGTVRIPFDQMSISENVIFATPQVNDVNDVCPANCLSCSNANTCIKDGCAVGYLNNTTGGCTKCPENCSVCTSIACPADLCKIGFRNDSQTGQCVTCSANCGKCDEQGCLDKNCLLGYVSDGKGGCVKCSDNCLTCDTTGCKACNEGFSLDASNNKCIGCAKNCVSCNTSGCLACAKGFFKKASDGLCTLNCPENCRTCSTKTSTRGCIECNADYSRTLNGDCIKCSENCAYCSSSGCSVCKAGSYLSNKQCVKCGENCNVCDSKGCLSYGCAAGFYRDSKSVCVKCDANCKLCKATGCSQCSDGFAVDSTTKSCKKCSDNCLLCSVKVCLKCAKNFNISSTGGCFKCPANCLRCNQKGCLNGFCDKGFGIDGKGGCVKCVANCPSCANNLCSSCNIGFSLSAQKDACVACSDNCLNCDSKGCRACKEGFYLSSGKCLACSANCSTCVSNKCSKCLSGFKLTSSNVGVSCVK